MKERLSVLEWLRWQVFVMKSRLGVLICKRKGHKWIDYSTAGPESGNVHLECARCGESHHQWLY